MDQRISTMVWAAAVGVWIGAGPAFAQQVMWDGGQKGGDGGTGVLESVRSQARDVATPLADPPDAAPRQPNPSTVLKELPEGATISFGFDENMDTFWDRFQNGAQVDHFVNDTRSNDGLTKLDESSPYSTLVSERPFPKQIKVTRVVRRLRYSIGKKDGDGHAKEYAWFIADKDSGWAFRSMEGHYITPKNAERAGGTLDVNDVKLEYDHGNGIFCDGSPNGSEPTVQTLQSNFGRFLKEITLP